MVGEPKRRSFGSQLIQMGLVGKGGVDARYRPEGLIVTFEATLADVRNL